MAPAINSASCLRAERPSLKLVHRPEGAKGADRFLLDHVRARMDMPATKEAVRALSERWPKGGAKLVEDKANGPAVIQELQHDVDGLIEVTPEGGKIARAHAAPQVEAGNIYLPHPAIAPWVEPFLDEAAAFPNGRNDDQLDVMTQALDAHEPWQVLRFRSSNRGGPVSHSGGDQRRLRLAMHPDY